MKLLVLLLWAAPALATGWCPAGVPDNWRDHGQPVQCFGPDYPCACGILNGNPQCVAAAKVPVCPAAQTLDRTLCACVGPTVPPSPVVCPTCEKKDKGK